MNTLINQIVDKFESQQLTYPFVYEDDSVKIYIRLPSSFPNFLIDSSKPMSSYAKHCPQIENLEIISGLGYEDFLLPLVKKILKIGDVQAIMINAHANENVIEWCKNQCWKKCDLQSFGESSQDWKLFQPFFTTLELMQD